ncbi:SpoIID/LytB domain-containing protein [Halobacteriovorax sp. YZS-1-1]|uniref:SpoIID/LytB domain-containing protein n=1 Tax=unclassified Halobacteriovorax TaxID=2639665 RepID=UPI0039999DE3
MRSLFLLFILLFTFNSFARISPLQNFKSGHTIKVRVAKNLNKVFLEGVGITREVIATNKSKSFKGFKKIKINCGNLKHARSIRPQYLASLTSKTGLIGFEKKQFMGQMHIVTSEDGKSCDVVNEMELDDYIATLLAKEMNASWPVEALKAQAVAARTYAIHHMMSSGLQNDTLYDLENSEKHQVNGTFNDVTASTIEAARKTAGMVLTNKDGNLVPAFFHASCGGNTLEPDDVWTNEVHGYSTVKCAYCQRKKNWDSKITQIRFKKMIEWGMRKGYVKKQKLHKKLSIYPDKKNAKAIYVRNGKNKIKIKKSLFRRYFGRVDFPSNYFYLVDLGREGLQFVGKGNGHGVGLCQVGALGLAQKGKGHKEILAHYFPKLNILKLY